MKRIKRQMRAWTAPGAPQALVIRAAGVAAIVIVPGAWALWLAWRVLRSRAAAS